MRIGCLLCNFPIQMIINFTEVLTILLVKPKCLSLKIGARLIPLDDGLLRVEINDLR